MHKSVLKEEILEFFRDGKYFSDVTIGTGGHTLGILEINKDAFVLGLDIHLPSLRIAERNLNKFKERVILRNENFINLKKVLKEIGWNGLDGILADLGISSYELEESGLGFSFKKNEELNMNLSGRGKKAKDFLNYSTKREIEKILKEYGEEPKAKKISEKIIEERKKKKIENTFDLVGIILKVKRRNPYKNIHPATQTFMALRIAVNKELENLKNFIPNAIEVLKGGGKLLIVSFHSLEDRIVKNLFKKYSGKCICLNPNLCICNPEKKGKILTKKPICPSLKEIEENPLSRSAKLRVFERL